MNCAERTIPLVLLHGWPGPRCVAPRDTATHSDCTLATTAPGIAHLRYDRPVRQCPSAGTFAPASTSAASSARWSSGHGAGLRSRACLRRYPRSPRCHGAGYPDRSRRLRACSHRRRSGIGFHWTMCGDTGLAELWSQARGVTTRPHRPVRRAQTRSVMPTWPFTHRVRAATPDRGFRFCTGRRSTSPATAPHRHRRPPIGWRSPSTVTPPSARGGGQPRQPAPGTWPPASSPTADCGLGGQPGHAAAINRFIAS
jgi:hypothetical protein